MPPIEPHRSAATVGVGIFDIDPPGREEFVEIIRADAAAGGELAVIKFGPLRGMTIRDWLAIVRRFPNAALDQPAEPAETQTVEAQADAIEEDLDIQCAVIAAGLGTAGDPEVEAALGWRLTPEERREAYAKVMRLTRPEERRAPLASGAAVPPARRANAKAGRGRGSRSSSSSTPSSAAAT